MSKKILSLMLALIIVANLYGCNQSASSPEISSYTPPEPTAVEVIPTEQPSEAPPSQDPNEVVIDEAIDEEPPKDITVYVSAYRLSVRADSDLQSTLLGSLSRGDAVKVINEVIKEETTWYQIQIENADNPLDGWILAEYTVQDMNELDASTEPFSDKGMNDYFTSSTLFDDNTIVAYYGHPSSETMGIVGRHSKEELIDLLKEVSDEYDAVNGNKGVVPAIYLVYGTVQPGGIIFKMKSDLVMSYIEEAYKNGVLIYLDHQIGKNSPIDALNEILPFLKYPNVHLALDPEWRTDKPMKELGHLTGTELNKIQETMRDYIISSDIPGKRQFVFHQFRDSMIRDVASVSVEYDPVLLVHCTSGWGSPDSKIATHTRNAKATNIPYKGFKLWYFFKPEVLHYDNPILTPEQVLNLDPQPGLVIYQ
jgi:hypothetical protein